MTMFDFFFIIHGLFENLLGMHASLGWPCGDSEFCHLSNLTNLTALHFFNNLETQRSYKTVVNYENYIFCILKKNFHKGFQNCSLIC